jgi:hypothetical protein
MPDVLFRDHPDFSIMPYFMVYRFKKAQNVNPENADKNECYQDEYACYEFHGMFW